MAGPEGEPLFFNYPRDMLIVSRTVFAEVPPHVEYALTEYGRTLAPVFQVMCAWGGKHLQRGESTSV